MSKEHKANGDENTDFHDRLKITAVKKLIWREVVFWESDWHVKMLSLLVNTLLKRRGFLSAEEKLTLGKPFYISRSFQEAGDFEETAKKICSALLPYTNETRGFIVNYSREGIFPNVTGEGLVRELRFSPEIIIDGKRLVASFPDD